jgi:hypothetical protein
MKEVTDHDKKKKNKGIGYIYKVIQILSLKNNIKLFRILG